MSQLLPECLFVYQGTVKTLVNSQSHIKRRIEHLRSEINKCLKKGILVTFKAEILREVLQISWNVERPSTPRPRNGCAEEFHLKTRNRGCQTLIIPRYRG